MLLIILLAAVFGGCAHWLAARLGAGASASFGCGVGVALLTYVLGPTLLHTFHL
jgi:hypothetical protein